MGDGKAVISDSKIADYVKSMAKKYDTYNKAKTLQMTGGGTVTISGGSYGWKINQSAEAAQIKRLSLRENKFQGILSTRERQLLTEAMTMAIPMSKSISLHRRCIFTKMEDW